MVFSIKVPKGELMRTTCSTARVSACVGRFMAASALCAVALCFAAPAAMAAESAPLAGNIVYLGGQHVKELKMPVVAFDHAAHAKANACASCHAAAPGVEKNSAGLPVNIMQTPVFSAFAGVASSDKDERKVAFHAACASCHAQKGGPSLAQCRSCHSVDDTAKLPTQKPFKPQMDASLHQRHLTSGAFPAKPQAGLAAGAIMAENDPQRCVACHHAKGFAPDLPPTVDSCRTCHASGPGTALATRDAAFTPPPLRAAAHEVCMKCHASLAEQKQPHGPVDCATCHDKARFEALPRFEASPSIMTMDRPTGVVLSDKVTPPQVPLAPIYPKGPKWTTAMPAVPFDHSLHERALNCVDCHHTSVKQSCITCHTPNGDPKGKNIPLAQAMHSVTSKNSCVNCHTSLTTAAPECAGCHTPRPVSKSGNNCAFCHRAAPGVQGTMGLMLPSNLPTSRPATPEASAANGSVALQTPALPQTLPSPSAQAAQQDAKLASSAILLPVEASVKAAAKQAADSEALLAPSAILLPPPDKTAAKPDPAANAAAAKALQPAGPASNAPSASGVPASEGAQPAADVSEAPKLGPVADGLPDKVRIELMSKEFRPVDFAHAQHLQKLHAAIGRKAAGLQGMHAKDGLECAACHHNSPRLKQGMTPPKCVSCHPVSLPTGVTTMPDGRPLLKAAYHQRCMDCHTRMKVEKPRATDCQACHIKRDPAEAPVW